MTAIGFVIQPGESIPGDVTDMVDAQSDGKEWPRWVRHDTQDAWNYWWDDERATRWRTELVDVARTGADLVAEAAAGWAPFTVTAVREQPAEPERGVVPDGPHTYLPGSSGWCEQLLDVGANEPVMCLLGRIAHAEPAAESVPVDVLDLVRQYVQSRIVAAVYKQNGEGPAVEMRAAEQADLWTRIEAEVDRLRGMANGWTVAVENVRRVEAERDDARANLARALQARGEFLDETIRLRAEVGRLTAERDAMSAHADHWEDEAVALREQLERGHVCTAACRPNSHVAFVGREALDEALAEVERYRRLLKTQAENFSAATDKLTAERDEARARVKLLEADLEFLAAESSPAPPAGPLVLTLPEVPEGAVALIGGNRWVRQQLPDVTQPVWKAELLERPLDLGSVLDLEPDGVRVEMAPPREPRTWKRTEITEDLPAVVDVEGHGRWRLRTDFDGSPMHYDQPGRGERQFRDLLAMGDVTEVFDEDGADRR